MFLCQILFQLSFVSLFFVLLAKVFSYATSRIEFALKLRAINNQTEYFQWNKRKSHTINTYMCRAPSLFRRNSLVHSNTSRVRVNVCVCLYAATVAVASLAEYNLTKVNSTLLHIRLVRYSLTRFGCTRALLLSFSRLFFFVVVYSPDRTQHFGNNDSNNKTTVNALYSFRWWCDVNSLFCILRSLRIGLIRFRFDLDEGSVAEDSVDKNETAEQKCSSHQLSTEQMSLEPRLFVSIDLKFFNFSILIPMITFIFSIQKTWIHSKIGFIWLLTLSPVFFSLSARKIKHRCFQLV